MILPKAGGKAFFSHCVPYNHKKLVFNLSNDQFFTLQILINSLKPTQGYVDTFMMFVLSVKF